ncbi:MAG: hypothetical protein WBL39_16220, partial [Terrimicrobiaceae bacterium]
GRAELFGLAGANTVKTDGEPRQLGIDDSGKRRNLPRRCWMSLNRQPELPLDIQHFHWRPPFVTRRNTAVRPQAANWMPNWSQTQRVRQEHRQQIPSSRAEKRSFCIKGTSEGEEIVLIAAGAVQQEAACGSKCPA